MLKRVLIANRGEIALRIIRAVRAADLEVGPALHLTPCDAIHDVEQRALQVRGADMTVPHEDVVVHVAEALLLLALAANRRRRQPREGHRTTVRQLQLALRAAQIQVPLRRQTALRAMNRRVHVVARENHRDQHRSGAQLPRNRIDALIDRLAEARVRRQDGALLLALLRARAVPAVELKARRQLPADGRLANLCIKGQQPSQHNRAAKQQRRAESPQHPRPTT